MDFEGLKQLAPFLIPLLALMIPIVAIVGGLVYRSRREELLHETVRQLSERGQSIPPELLDGKLIDAMKTGKSSSRNSQLRGGAVNIAAGLGLMVMFWAMKPESWLWAIGCIPLFIGVAMLLVWRYESKQTGPERD